MQKIQSHDQVMVNNEVVKALSSTIAFSPGNPEITLTPTQGETYSAVDFSTAKAKIEFEIANTLENQALTKKWAEKNKEGQTLTVRILSTGEAIENAVLTNALTFNYSNEGSIKITIEGDPTND